MRIGLSLAVTGLAILTIAANLTGQNAPTGVRGVQSGRGAQALSPAYPDRPPGDPVVVARGQVLFGVNCSFCHGSDAKGGDGGPSLILSQLVLDDQHGELIATVVQNGRPERGMPKFDLSAAQITDLAAFIHSIPVTSRSVAAGPINILGGVAKAGEAYFNVKCVSCHSVTGDLKGVATKFSDPKALQQEIVMPGGKRGGFGTQLVPEDQLKAPPTTVTVMSVTGEKTEGRLRGIDDFSVTLVLGDGTLRTFRRDGDRPKVELHDPLAGHKALLGVYSDNDIHNLTAYLVTLK